MLPLKDKDDVKFLKVGESFNIENFDIKILR